MKKLKQIYWTIRFVKAINKGIKVRFQKIAFQCNIDDAIVYIPFKSIKESDSLFKSFVNVEFGKNNFNFYLLSILHEIGHCYTYEDELQDDKKLRLYTILNKYQEKEIDSNQANWEYFKIPMEYEATRWGVEFYKANQDFCEKFSKKLQKVVDKDFL